MRFRSLLIFALCFVVGSIAAVAQTTSGSISGAVVDPKAAAVVDAKVTVSDASKGFSVNATTDSQGRFVFPQLAPGTYKLTVEATGFKTLSQVGVALVANDKLTLGDLAMEVGAATETVSVTGDATQIQSESGERSYAIQGEALRNIAVNGRGFTPLASITPGIVFQGVSSGSNDNLSSISANGLRLNSNSLQLDGISIMDTGNNGTLLNISLDSVAEFKVLTSDYQAEYGRSAGAQISAVTRGGARDFHGSFYAFRRHDGMNANTWVNNREAGFRNVFINKPRLDQRDLGFTISGPIYIPKHFNTDRQKLFFFFSQERQKRLVPPTGPTRVTVPTALERMGDFSQSVNNSGGRVFVSDPTILDSAGVRVPCTAANTAATPGGCFVSNGQINVIPANRLFSLGLNILKIYPLPNTTGTGFNYSTEAVTNTPERQDLVRIDYNLNSNWRLSGRYVQDTSNRLFAYGSFVLGDNLPDYPAKYVFPRYSYSVTATGTLNPTTVLETTFGLSHNAIDITPGSDKFNKTALGLTGFPTIFPSAVQLDLPPQFGFNGSRLANSPNVGSNNAPFTNFNTIRNVVSNLSKIWGQHTLKAGIFWENSFKPQSSFANNNGTINFGDNSNNPLDTGFGFSNAALGIFNSYNQASGYFVGRFRYNNVEWYLQDNWKVNNRLTLDYGIRFYLIQPQYDETGQTANFLPGSYSAANAPALYRPICIGANPCGGGARRAVDPRLLVGGFIPTINNTIDSIYIGRLVPGTGQLLNGVLKSGNGIEKGLYKNRGVEFAPRFGFAYDVTGKQKLIVRGGAGVFYDRPQGNVVFDLITNPPTTLTPTFNFGRLQDIGTGPLLLAPPNLVAYDHEGKTPTIYSFNVGVQYKLPLQSILDVSYVGTVGSHLLQRRNINAPAYGAAFLAQNQDPTRAASTVPGANALPTDFLRPFPGFGTISYIEPASSSNYHSMQTSLNRRFSKGLLMGVNYTWSNALGTQGNDLPGVTGFGAPRSDSNQRSANYGPQDFDRRHNFNVNWVYELPKATTNHTWGYLANDWQISGIYRYQTGQPYNISVTIPNSTSQNVTGTGDIEGARVVLIGNPGSGHSSDPYRQFDVTAFTSARSGSLALESGRNFLRRSPINNWDLSLTKRFKFAERATLELRVDAFNALNHTQFDAINSTLIVTSLTNPTPTNLAFKTDGTFDRNGFGAVNSVRPPRNMQISAHIIF